VEAFNEKIRKHMTGIFLERFNKEDPNIGGSKSLE